MSSLNDRYTKTTFLRLKILNLPNYFSNVSYISLVFHFLFIGVSLRYVEILAKIVHSFAFVFLLVRLNVY